MDTDKDSRLRNAENAVSAAIENVERQREIVARAERTGIAASVESAKALLAKLEDSLKVRVEYRDQIKLDLAQKTASGDAKL